MIKYLTNEEIDKKKWDTCIDDSFNGIVYAKTWYLDVVADNWEALVENDYERVFPLIHGKKWGISYLFQPVFTQQLGVFSKSLLTEDKVAEFLSAIPGKYRFAEINLNSFNKLSKSYKGAYSWKNYELDLINSYENLQKHYSTNLKRNLKKAEAHKLTLVKNTKPEEIIRIFRENRGRSVSHLHDPDYMKLSRLVYTGIYKGITATYGVYNGDNELCAGAIFVRSKKKSIFLFSGLTKQGREQQAMAFLIDSYIREHAQHHLTFDFEGSNNPSLARFYAGFGATETNYPHLKINRLPWLVSLGIGILKKIRGN